jgi:septum formation protein
MNEAEMSTDPAPIVLAPIVLASASPTRRALLAAAGVEVAAVPARLDEAAIIAALAADGLKPRDIADALAEAKARRLAARHPEAVVIGCDQVLELDGAVMDKANDVDAVRSQLLRLRGRTHLLHTAAVIFHHGDPVWRHVEGARLTMRAASDAYLDAYLERNGAALVGTAGGYRIEGEGARLFSRIDGDHFGILGLPLIPVLNYLARRGWIAG